MDKRECLQQLLTKGRQRLSDCHSRSRQLDGLKGILFMRRDIACQALEKHLTQLQARLTNILDQRLAQIEQLCAEKEIHISSEKSSVLKKMSTLTQICGRSTDFLQFGNEELCKTKDCEEVILSFEKILQEYCEHKCSYLEEKHINLSYVPLLPDETMTMSSVGMLKTSHLDPHSVEIERCRDKPREVSQCASLKLNLFIKTNASCLSADDLELFKVKVTDSNNAVKPITVVVCSDQPNKLQVTFSPTFPEAYQLSVMLYDIHVLNSPYKFSVRSDPNKGKCARSRSESGDLGNLSRSPSQISSETDGASKGNCLEFCKAGNQKLANQKSGSLQNSNNVCVSTEKQYSCKSIDPHQPHGTETNQPNSSQVNDLESRDNIQGSSVKSQSRIYKEEQQCYKNNDPHHSKGARSGSNFLPPSRLECKENNKRSSARSQSGNFPDKEQVCESTDLHQFIGRGISGSNSLPLNGIECEENLQILSPRSQSNSVCGQVNSSGPMSQSESTQINGSGYRSNSAQRFSPKSSRTISEAERVSNNESIGQTGSAQRNEYSKQFADQEEISRPSRDYGESPSSRIPHMSPRSHSVMVVGSNGSARFQAGQTSTPRFTNCYEKNEAKEALGYSSSTTSDDSEKYSPNRDNYKKIPREYVRDRNSQGNCKDDCGQNPAGNIEHAICRHVEGDFKDGFGQNPAGNIEHASCRHVERSFKDDCGQNSAGNIEHAICRHVEGNFKDGSDQNPSGNIEHAICRYVEGNLKDDCDQNPASNIEHANRNLPGNLEDSNARNSPHGVKQMEGRNSSGTSEQSRERDIPSERVKLTAKRCQTPRARTAQGGIYMSASDNGFRTLSRRPNPHTSGLSLRQWEAQGTTTELPIQTKPNNCLNHNFR